jgi:phage-related protein
MEQVAGTGWIDIAIRGFEKVQGQLNTVGASLKKATSSINFSDMAQSFAAAGSKMMDTAKALSEQFTKIGAVATKAFMGSAAAITGFVRLASPRGFDDLTVALATVGIQLGTIFVPLLRAATTVVNQFANYLKGLTDAQKDQILHWAKIGLAIAGVLMIVPRIIAGINLVRGAMLSFGASSAVATGGISLLIGAAAMAIPYLVQLFRGGGGANGLGGAFAAAGAALERLWNFAKSVFERISPIVERIVGVVGAIVEPVISIFMRGLDALEPVINGVIDIFGEVAGLAGEILVPVFHLLGTVIEGALALLQPIFQAFGLSMTSVSQVIRDYVRPAFHAIGQAIEAVVTAMKNSVNSLIDVMNGLIRWYNSSIFTAPSRLVTGNISEVRRVGEQTGALRSGRTLPPQDHHGDVRQAVQLIGIAELWKKAQTSQVDDPQTRIAREQLAAANRAADAAEQTAQNTAPQQGMGTGGAVRAMPRNPR